ncbi:MAG: AAA family ATPase [Candidatus Hermodarchaeota archaeon]
MVKKNKIIVISGFSGSGKSSVSGVFKKKGYKVISVSETLKKYFQKNIPNFTKISENSRQRHIKEILLKKPLLPGEEIKKAALKNKKNKIVLDGVRGFRDLVYLDNYDLIIIFLYSNFNLRKKRVSERKKTSLDQNLKKRDFLDYSVGIGDVIKNANFLIKNERLLKNELFNLTNKLIKNKFKPINHKALYTKITRSLLTEVKENESKIKRIRM